MKTRGGSAFLPALVLLLAVGHHGCSSERTGANAQERGVVTVQSEPRPGEGVRGVETGSYLIRADGVLLLRPGRYDLRGFQERDDPALVRVEESLLRTIGLYELRQDMRIVLLPHRSRFSESECSECRIRESRPRVAWNVLGSSGWYAIQPDMQLHLFPARGEDTMPPTIGGRAMAERRPRSKQLIIPFQVGFYFIASSGDLIIMPTSERKAE